MKRLDGQALRSLQRRCVGTLLSCRPAAALALLLFLCTPWLPAPALHLTAYGLSLSSGPDPNQILSEAQNDLNVANSIVTSTGVFVGLITIAIAIAGIFEIRGLSRLQTHIQQATLLDERIKAQIAQLADTTEENLLHLETQLNTLHQQSERERLLFEERLKQLDQRSAEERLLFEKRLDLLDEHYKQENQKFMEASYNFAQGKAAYMNGDDIHAIKFFSRALQLQPHNVRILERLGRTFRNRDDMRQATYYLEQALVHDPQSEAALRSLALCYRYTEPEKAMGYLEHCLQINPNGYEALDFLGLIHRDQGRLDEAIRCHERARTINERPETDFYVSLLYASQGNLKTALLQALIAEHNTYQQEHDLRMRPIWRHLIYAAVKVLNGEKEQALHVLQMSEHLITTHRIHAALKDHLVFLLKATGHDDWLPEVMALVRLTNA